MTDHDDIPGPNELPRLAAALRELERAPAVPAAIDAAILARARRTTHNAQRRTALRWLPAAAAAVLLIVGMATWRASAPQPAAPAAAPMSPPPAPGLAVAVPERDLNADGVVDIIDAYLLARRLEHERERLDVATLDQDADGALTRADVDAIAMIAVALPGRPR